LWAGQPGPTGLGTLGSARPCTGASAAHVGSAVGCGSRRGGENVGAVDSGTEGGERILERLNLWCFPFYYCSCNRTTPPCEIPLYQGSQIWWWGGVLEEKMVAEPGRWRRRLKVDARV
jgi:hypothetical protein